MSDKKPPTQYITLKPIKFFEDDLGQLDDPIFDIKALLEKQLHLVNKKKEYALEIESLTNAMSNIDAEMKDNQVRLDKLQGYMDAGENKEGE